MQYKTVSWQFFTYPLLSSDESQAFAGRIHVWIMNQGQRTKESLNFSVYQKFLLAFVGYPTSLSM